MKKPLVTIGLAFRDPGPDFELAVRSVFAQTYDHWELLLCDDGSSDGALEFAKSLRDPRVRVVSDGRKKTLAIRLNEMVALAAGEFFFRMDADDVMHPDRVRRQLQVLSSAPADCVVGSAAYAIDAASRVTGFKPAGVAQFHGFAARMSFYHATVAAPMEWFRRNPYSELPLFYRSEDAELWCRTTASTQFRWIPEPLMYIREVGVFSCQKYLGTAMGVLSLAAGHSRRGPHRLRLMTLQLAKTWTMIALDAFGKTDWVIRRRGRALDAAELPGALEALERVQSTPVPVDGGSRVDAEFWTRLHGRAVAV